MSEEVQGQGTPQVDAGADVPQAVETQAIEEPKVEEPKVDDIGSIFGKKEEPQEKEKEEVESKEEVENYVLKVGEHGEDAIREMLGDDTDNLLSKARELGITQEQMDFFLTHSMGVKASVDETVKKYEDMLNPNRDYLATQLDGDTKAMIKSGQLENYLIKVTGDEGITSRVNEAFTTPAQYKILTELAQGYARSVAGLGGIGAAMSGGYNTKEDYFIDLKRHEKLIAEGNKLEAKRLMADIKHKKKMGISTLFD